MSIATQTRTRAQGPIIPEGFALFAGGPFLSLLRRWPALRPLVDSPLRRVLFAVAVTWLPLLLLSLRGGSALSGVPMPFLSDAEVNARTLLMVPLLIFGAVQAQRVITPGLEQFANRGIVRAADRERFRQILSDTSHWNQSFLLRFVIIAVVAALGQALWRDQMASQLAAWYGSPTGAGTTFTPAGRWMLWVTNPIVQYLHLLWIVRFLMYALMLARIAALNLHLLPTHPDRAGGVGFLGARSYGFVTVAAAEGAAIAGILSNRIVHEGRSLMLFKIDIAVAAVLVIAAILGPLCVFVPKLMRAQYKGKSEYGDVANRYAREFEEAWVFGKADAEGRALLGAADVQSLADMANSYDVVARMRWFPFSIQDAIQIGVAFLLPIAPLLLTEIPAEELIGKLIRILIG